MSPRKSIAREKKTISLMIHLFCRDHHDTKKDQLCDDCTDLLDYANERLEKCPFGPDKGPCSKCHIHCYKVEMRDKIRQVMRYSGPRMLTRHPILAVDHLIKEKFTKEKPK
jgi:hypothetical protein